MNISGKVRLITSGNVPTTDNLRVGELAFGKITDDGKVHLYGNPGNGTAEGTIVELAIEVGGE